MTGGATRKPGADETVGLSIEPNHRISFGVRFEGDGLLVVDKPPGVVTAPGIGHEHDTLLNALYARHGHQLQNLGRERDFGLVHRLDRGTSGLIMVALTREVYDGLRGMFLRRSIDKFYLAVCHKPPREPTGVIRLPLAESVRRTGRYTSVKRATIRGQESKPALTAYRVLASNELGAIVEARPITGRLHQVRAHLASVGSALFGDPLYGPRRISSTSRLALHAHRLRLEHPATGEALDLRSPLPKDLRRLLARLGLPRPEDIGVEDPEPGDADDPGATGVEPVAPDHEQT